MKTDMQWILLLSHPHTLTHWMSPADCRCKDCVLLFQPHSKSGTALGFRGTRVCVPPAIKCLFNCYIELLEQSKAAFRLLSTWPTVFSDFIISLLQYHCYFTLYFFHNPWTVYAFLVIYCMWFPPIYLCTQILHSFLFQRFAKHSKESARNIQVLS